MRSNLRRRRTADARLPGHQPRLGKVPTIVHDGAVVTEQSAIYPYLADDLPRARHSAPLRSAIPERGARICAGWRSTARASSPRWSIAHLQREAGQTRDVALRLRRCRDRGGGATSSAVGPFMLGDRFSAARHSLGRRARLDAAVQDSVPDRPVFTAYAGRIAGRASSPQGDRGRRGARGDAVMNRPVTATRQSGAASTARAVHGGSAA